MTLYFSSTPSVSGRIQCDANSSDDVQVYPYHMMDPTCSPTRVTPLFGYGMFARSLHQNVV